MKMHHIKWMHPAIGEIKWKIKLIINLGYSFTNSCEVAHRLQTSSVSDQAIGS